MSDANRSIEEYIQCYARDYCGDDAEKAKTHAIVREVIREKDTEQNVH